MIPGFGGIPRLKRDLGNAVVRDLLLTGRSFNATKAQQIGLVSQVVSEGEALRAARATAAQIGKFDRQTAVAAKQFIKPIPHEELRKGDRHFLRVVFASGRAGGIEEICGEHGRAAVFAVSRDAVRNPKQVRITYMETAEKTLDEILTLAAAHFKVPREKLSPDEDFFKALGIDSLQTLDLLTKPGKSLSGRTAGLRTARRDRLPHTRRPRFRRGCRVR